MGLDKSREARVDRVDFETDLVRRLLAKYELVILSIRRVVFRTLEPQVTYGPTVEG